MNKQVNAEDRGRLGGWAGRGRGVCAWKKREKGFAEGHTPVYTPCVASSSPPVEVDAVRTSRIKIKGKKKESGKEKRTKEKEGKNETRREKKAAERAQGRIVDGN